MNTRQIDLLNIGLMAGSFAVAFMVPVELLLFSYIILGPLHYLTEMAWLRERQYFTKEKNDYILLTALCLLATAGIIYAEIRYFPSLVAILDHVPFFHEIGTQSQGYIPVFMFLALAMAIAVVVTANFNKRAMVFIIALGASMLLVSQPYYYIVFAMLLPTLIHTFIFTIIFILAGITKSKSKAGMLSLALFVSLGIACFMIPYISKTYIMAGHIRDGFLASNFAALTGTIIDMISQSGSATEDSIFNSIIGIQIQRFLAFTYTYHYLNWFSKTSIIQWHKVDKRWLIAVIFIWLSSISLHLYSMKLGLIMLFFIAMLHVILELPLNFHAGRMIYHNLTGNKSSIQPSGNSATKRKVTA